VIVLSRAAIVAVGSELLTPSKLDTNSLHITGELNRLGIDVIAKAVVGDSRDELTHTISAMLTRVDLLILCGGLGPTDDDVTREAVAVALHRPLSEDEAITARLRERFKARGFAMPMPETNRRQAMVPAGAVVIENTKGSAPGLWIDHDGKTVVLLPGPPRELKPMLASLVEGQLRERAPGEPLMRRIVRITGRIESDVDQLLQPQYKEWASAVPPIAATILAQPGAIELHVSAQASSQDVVDRVLESAVQRIVETIGADVYSTDGRKLEQVVGDLLVAKRLHVAAAESCTGGLITSRLTDVPGSSRYVDQSVITYSNQAKTVEYSRRGERARRAGDGRRNPHARRRRCRHRRHRYCGSNRRHAREACGHGGRRRHDDARTPLPHLPVFWRPRAREVPGLAGGARHGQAPADVEAGLSLREHTCACSSPPK
jgi:nicotinamide-nucleotide amidase